MILMIGITNLLIFHQLAKIVANQKKLFRIVLHKKKISNFVPKYKT